MKQKLSLILSLVMVLTLMPVRPAQAATLNTMDNPRLVSSDSEIKESEGHYLTVGKGSDSSNRYSGLNSDDKFTITLEGEPEWNYDGDKAGMNYTAAGQRTDRVTSDLTLTGSYTAKADETPAKEASAEASVTLSSAGGLIRIDIVANGQNYGTALNTASDLSDVVSAVNSISNIPVQAEAMTGGIKLTTKNSVETAERSVSFTITKNDGSLISSTNTAGNPKKDATPGYFKTSNFASAEGKITVKLGTAEYNVRVAHSDGLDAVVNKINAVEGLKDSAIASSDSGELKVTWKDASKTEEISVSGTLKKLDSRSATASYTISVPSSKTIVVSMIKAEEQIKIPLAVKMNGAASGDARLTIVSGGSNVSSGSFVYAKIADSKVLLGVEKVAKISRVGKNNVTLTLSEAERRALSKGEEIVLRLPVGFKWDDGKETNVNGNFTTNARKVENDGRDLRIIVLDGMVYENTNDKIFINAKIDVSRDARLGDVDVTVKKGNNVSPTSLKIAENVTEAVTVSVKNVVDVIAGKDVEGKYKVEVEIEENVENALLSGRFMEFTFEKGNASLQDGETLKLDTVSGTANVLISAGSSDAFHGDDSKEKNICTYIAKDKTIKADNFELDVKDSSKNGSKSKLRLTIPFVVESDFTGDLILNVKGAGVSGEAKNGGVDVKVATVKAPVTVKTDDQLAQVKIGLQDQPGAKITITETEAGALQDFEPVANVRSEDGTLKQASGTGRGGYALYNVSRSKDFSIAFTKAKVEVTNGDLSLNKDETGRKADRINIAVDRASTKPSTIEISDVKMTLDRTVPYGDVKLRANFGLVGKRADMTNTVVAFDYIKTLTPVSEETRVATIFKIGQAGYTKVVGNTTQAVEGDVAPFISNGRTLVPVRQAAEALGAVVNWNADTKVASFQRGSTVASIKIDTAEVNVNGVKSKLTALENRENRILVPVAELGMIFGLQHGKDIIWDEASQTVIILPQNATEEEKSKAMEVAGLAKSEPVEAPKEEAKPAEEAKPEEKPAEEAKPAA